IIFISQFAGLYRFMSLKTTKRPAFCEPGFKESFKEGSFSGPACYARHHQRLTVLNFFMKHTVALPLQKSDTDPEFNSCLPRLCSPLLNSARSDLHSLELL